MTHSWSVLAQKFSTQRYRCKVCGAIKTVSKRETALPLTKYELAGKTFLKAPVCEAIV